MNINAYILLKNKRVKKLSIDPEKPFFEYRNNIYILDKESIGLRRKDGVLSPKPMCIYFEGIPTAIRNETQDQEMSAKLLDQFVQESNIRGASTTRVSQFSWIIDFVKDPQKIFLYCIYAGLGIYILYYIINLVISGGMHL